MDYFINVLCTYALQTVVIAKQRAFFKCSGQFAYYLNSRVLYKWAIVVLDLNSAWWQTASGSFEYRFIYCENKAQLMLWQLTNIETDLR